MLTEAFYILFFYFTGEFISYFIDGFIPGSVIGMVLLFLALAFKKVKPEKVKRLSTVLTQTWIILRSCRCRLMNSFGIISEYWAVLLIASVVSTILVIASVAWCNKNWKRENRPWIIWRIPRFSLLPW